MLRTRRINWQELQYFANGRNTKRELSVIPGVLLVFCSLVMGIMGIGSIAKTGKIALHSLLWFTGTTAFASFLGLILPRLLHLGEGAHIVATKTTVKAASFGGLLDTVEHLIPDNPINAFAQGNMLQVLVFAIFIGVACLSLGEKAKPAVDLIDAVNEISIWIVSKIMLVTPLGVSACIATVNMDAVSIVMSFMITFFASALDIHLSVGTMVTILASNVLLSIGTPGVPGGAIAAFAALAPMAHLPLSQILGVYISVNTLADMGVTCVNVLGDLAVATVLKHTLGKDKKHIDVQDEKVQGEAIAEE